MKFGSLFAGIGGFDLGLERAGMTCQWQVEIEDYPTKILEKHWPGVHRERDIKECSGENLGPVDLICGGFPCQDISVAGAGAGLAGERSGLWYEMHRIISDIKPRWVVVENVAALLHRGLDVVLRDLSTIGYDCEWHIISASAVGAPHRRERVWIVGNSNSYSKSTSPVNDETPFLRKDVANTNSLKHAMRRDSEDNAEALAGRNDNARGSQRDSRTGCKKSTGESSRNVPNANGKRLEGKRANDDTQRRKEERGQAGLCNRKELSRYSSWWEAEPSVGRVADGISRRVDRLKGLGNAVVPQIVELIGRRIMEIEGNL